MAKTQKNKATSFHLGQLKAKLAKLKRELLTPSSGGGGAPGAGFDVAKTGIASVGFIGCAYLYFVACARQYGADVQYSTFSPFRRKVQFDERSYWSRQCRCRLRGE